MGYGPDIGGLCGLTADHVVRISSGTSPGELTDQKDRRILRPPSTWSPRSDWASSFAQNCSSAPDEVIQW